MGNRLLRVVLASAIAASIVVAGPSAQAAHCGTYGQVKPIDPNIPTPVEYGFINVNVPHVVVNPDQAAPWALAVVDYYMGLPGWATCEAGLGEPISCAWTIALKVQEIALDMRPEEFHLRYVYKDEAGWHVAGERLIADAGAAGCLLA